MTGSIDTLIRLQRHLLDERRQELAELERLAARLAEELRRLDEEARSEARLASISFEAGSGFGGFAAGLAERRVKLVASVAGVEARLIEAREALSEAYLGVKRYELAAAHRAKLVAERRARRQSNELDEIALQVFRRTARR